MKIFLLLLLTICFAAGCKNEVKTPPESPVPTEEKVDTATVIMVQLSAGYNSSVHDLSHYSNGPLPPMEEGDTLKFYPVLAGLEGLVSVSYGSINNRPAYELQVPVDTGALARILKTLGDSLKYYKFERQ